MIIEDFGQCYVSLAFDLSHCIRHLFILDLPSGAEETWLSTLKAMRCAPCRNHNMVDRYVSEPDKRFGYFEAEAEIAGAIPKSLNCVLRVSDSCSHLKRIGKLQEKAYTQTWNADLAQSRDI